MLDNTEAYQTTHRRYTTAALVGQLQQSISALEAVTELMREVHNDLQGDQARKADPVQYITENDRLALIQQMGVVCGLNMITSGMLESIAKPCGIQKSPTLSKLIDAIIARRTS